MTPRPEVTFEVPLGREQPIATCRSCRAPIFWVETAAGKRMPLSVRLARDVDGKLRAPSHFFDCPDAATHRRATR